MGTARPYQTLRIARIVFLVLAYLFAGLNLVFAGLIPLFMGGDPIPVLSDGSEIPARLFGLLSLFISTPMAFLFFYVPSGVIKLLLELWERLPSGSTGFRGATS